MCHYYFPGLILNLVVANFAGGVHSDLGDPLRLPVPQVVRRHRQIRQGVRPRRLGARQPGQPAQPSPAQPAFLSVPPPPLSSPWSVNLTALFYDRFGVVCWLDIISRDKLHPGRAPLFYGCFSGRQLMLWLMSLDNIMVSLAFRIRLCIPLPDRQRETLLNVEKLDA